MISQKKQLSLLAPTPQKVKHTQKILWGLYLKGLLDHLWGMCSHFYYLYCRYQFYEFYTTCHGWHFGLCRTIFRVHSFENIYSFHAFGQYRHIYIYIYIYIYISIYIYIYIYSKNVYFYHGFIILIGFVKYISLLIRDVFQLSLTLNAPCISESCIEIKIKLKFLLPHFFVVQ